MKSLWTLGSVQHTETLYILCYDTTLLVHEGQLAVKEINRSKWIGVDSWQEVAEDRSPLTLGLRHASAASRQSSVRSWYHSGRAEELLSLVKRYIIRTCCESSRISSASLADVSSLQRAARSSQLCFVLAGRERHSLPTMRDISPGNIGLLSRLYVLWPLDGVWKNRGLSTTSLVILRGWWQCVEKKTRPTISWFFWDEFIWEELTPSHKMSIWRTKRPMLLRLDRSLTTQSSRFLHAILDIALVVLCLPLLK